ncbi:hypothetical protein K523DRAFT_308419 [Schizophyllum commune Tattone D]|nr:hypothetical protein K523DRAFT_308419 [Schizophyllum commune Tattone D]
MNGASSSRGAGSRTKPLKRGKACMNCRFLKIKCDGARPVCGPCLKHPKDDECEYDGPGRSRTKALEEQVHRLESRIQELENPGETTPSVTLHEPYSPTHQLSLSPHSSPPSHTGISLSASISPYETTPASTGSPSLLDRPHALPIKSSSSGGSRASPSVADRKPFSPFEEPDVSVIRVLLDNFLPHASEFGFFLSTSRFYNAALVPAPAGHVTRPLPALLFAVYLFGVHLSRTDSSQAQSSTFLNQALQTLSVALTSGHPQRVLHTIQTHVLLSYFFYRSGLNIEAKYHAAAACSLVISSGLHKVRSPSAYPGAIGESPIQTSPILLHKPVADAIEEGERISALWSTFALSRLLAVALDPPDAICGVFDVPGVQIDTPWPLTMKEYEDGAMPENLQSTATVRNFVTNNDWYSGDGNSGAALFAKAVILIHRAAYVAGLFSDPMSQRDYQTFSSLFTTTHSLLSAFRERLPPLIVHTPPLLAHGAAFMPHPSSPPPQDPALRTLLLTHNLMNAAFIKLHMPFFRSDPVSRQHCVAAAQAMFDFGNVDIRRFHCLNPIVGTLWTLAVQVLIDEVVRLRTAWAGAHSLPGGVVPYDATEDGLLMRAEEEASLGRLRLGIQALDAFADDSALMSTCSLLAAADLSDFAADLLPTEMQAEKCKNLFANVQ